MKLNFSLRLALLCYLLFVGASAVKAQQTYFEPAETSRMRLDASLSRTIKKLSFYTINENDLRIYLAKAPLEFTNTGPALPLQIPLPNGTLETFSLVESPVLAPAIAARHPEIKTYTGKGETHKEYTIRISFTSHGFNAIALGLDHDAVYYEKVSTDKSDHVYRVYAASDAEKPKRTLGFGQTSACGTLHSATKNTGKTTRGGRTDATATSSGTTLRTFRLALAADAEFTQQPVYGGDVNAAFDGLVGYVNRINAVYRVELSVHFTLVSDVSLVYANSATDPYTNSDQLTMIYENQANLNAVVGNGNYDIGHVLGYVGSAGGGLSVIGSTCDPSMKGMATSGVGDGSFGAIFDDQLICHELGHQFNMTHSYNSSIPVCTTREPDTAVEPGSGVTIMSYNFTCSDATGNDDYEQPDYQPLLNFHTVNYGQAIAFMNTINCFSSTTTGNAIPVITTLPTSMTVPKSTPFALTGAAIDSDATNVLSYSWEGTNIGASTPDPTTLENTAQPPFFRSYEPVSSGTRYFPRLSAVLNGATGGKGDKLPSVGITTTHRLTVRDNVGGLTYGEVTVTIDGNSGPFVETTHLSGAYPGNSAKTITWDVANTTSAPVSCSLVTILLSTDGGLTFPTTLAVDTPNDGSATIVLPTVLTTDARVKIQSSNNVFFAISDTNFSISAPLPAACPDMPIAVITN